MSTRTLSGTPQPTPHPPTPGEMRRPGVRGGADGAPTPEIVSTQADRLANWRMLQELAGLR